MCLTFDAVSIKTAHTGGIGAFEIEGMVFKALQMRPLDI